MSSIYDIMSIVYDNMTLYITHSRVVPHTLKQLINKYTPITN